MKPRVEFNDLIGKWVVRYGSLVVAAVDTQQEAENAARKSAPPKWLEESQAVSQS